VLTLVSLIVGTGRVFAAAEADDDSGWLRVIQENGKELTVFLERLLVHSEFVLHRFAAQS